MTSKRANQNQYILVVRADCYDNATALRNTNIRNTPRRVRVKSA